MSMFGLPLIKGLHSLSSEIGLSPGLLFNMTVSNHKFYRSFDIPKKTGAPRTIHAPSRDMKAVQAWILRNILDKVQFHPAATGFIRSRSIRDNASPHQSNLYLLCVDIEDFFPSIGYGKVYNTFRTLGYNPHTAHIFTKLCTFEGKLPQGAVTSPALSNIICTRLDRRMSSFVGERNITYTRYADDLTFSCMSPNLLSSILPTIGHIIETEDFVLNDRKTRRMGPRQQRRVTGLVLSEGRVGIGRKRRRTLRAKIHKVLCQKAATAASTKLEAHMRGWLAHLNAVDKRSLAQLRNFAASFADSHNVPNTLE